MQRISELLAIGVFVLGATGVSVATEATIDRDEEFLVLTGAEVSGLAGVALDELGVFSWQDGAFVPIPFQVDEAGPNGGYFGEDEAPDIIDDTDEIVFMMRDVGDQATAEDWIVGADAVRYEVEAEDPLNLGEMGWFYIFTGSGLPASGDDYADLVTANPMEISTPVYREVFKADSPATQELMEMLPPFGNGVDHLDRIKLRTKLLRIGGWDTEDDSDIDPDRWHQKDGPIRVINSFSISLGNLVDLSRVTVYFYREMTVVHNDVNQILPTGVRHMLWMEDLSPNANGEFWYHDNRGDDPTADATLSDLVDGNGVNGDGLRAIGDRALFNEWASAQYGRTIFIQDTSVIDAASIESYYCDGCTENPWSDTGDGETWGEYGTWIKSVAFGSFSLDAWNYRLSGENPEVSVGGEYARRYLNPITHAVESQDQVPVGISGDLPGVSTRAMSLEQNRPNPFNPQTQISYTVPEGAGHVRLAIHDAAGRVVRVLVDAPTVAGSYVANWDGRDEAGRTVSSGVYVSRLEAGEVVMTRKMALVK